MKKLIALTLLLLTLTPQAFAYDLTDADNQPVERIDTLLENMIAKSTDPNARADIMQKLSGILGKFPK